MLNNICIYRIRQTHDINLLFVNLKGRQNDYTAQTNVKNILKSMIVRSLFLIFHFSLYLCGWTITILNLYATDILSFYVRPNSVLSRNE